MAGRLLVIGDIHGFLTPLNLLLDHLKPDLDDTLVTLGDYIDRGPDSKNVLLKLIQLKTLTNLRMLIGNHDLMFLESIHFKRFNTDWLLYGGLQTLESFGVDLANPDFQLFDANIIDFLKSEGSRYWEDEKHIFVHAGVDPLLPLDQQTDKLLFWDKLAPDFRGHYSGKKVVCGHTRQISGQPLNLGHLLCLDTNVYSGGWLTCCDLNTMDFWQANALGEFRHIKPCT
ncbi:MAG: serine/threonine protein phosphatase [Planctomycetes bacterium]|nr:serine/threonine protein phosphatase [Planctomycetota bacterium]NBY01354.1 serine/threonine protein phosphatase [Planctomycetota bacterium]